MIIKSISSLSFFCLFVFAATVMASSSKGELQSQLDEKKASSKAPPEIRKIMNDATNALQDSEIVAKAKQKGEAAPTFGLPNAQGGELSLAEQLKKGPVVLTFYRGEWCPYCNMQLFAYQKRLAEMRNLGAELVAVSPEKYDSAKETIRKSDLDFPVLSDAGNKVARSYGLVFALSPKLKGVYEKFGIDLVKNQGNDNWELPIAATYVIQQNGEIAYAFLSADYTQRAETQEIIDVLKKLQAQ